MKALLETNIPGDQVIYPWKGIKFDPKTPSEHLRHRHARADPGPGVRHRLALRVRGQGRRLAVPGLEVTQVGVAATREGAAPGPSPAWPPRKVGTMADQLLQQIVNGLLIGSVYSLVAIGLTLIWGVMNILNFAHGDFLMIGMFISFWLYTLFRHRPALLDPGLRGRSSSSWVSSSTGSSSAR